MNNSPEKTRPKSQIKSAYNKSYSAKAFLSKLNYSLLKVNLFAVLSATLQITFGMIVTSASIINLINPMWFSAICSFLGCIVTMLGLYQLYEIYKCGKITQDLARDAIERAIRSRN